MNAKLLGALFSSCVVLLVSCSSGRDGEAASADDLGPATPAVTVTTTIPNRPPVLRVPSVARAELDEEFTDSIVGSDPDGDDVVVRVGSAPLGFSPTVNSRGRIVGISWRPTVVGEWEVAVTATDAQGLTTSETIRLIARAPRRDDLLLAMGDSIAGGFGRDRTDFLGTDDCFRSESDSYATLTSDLLVDAGALSESSQLLLVACADANTTLLGTASTRATNAVGDIVGGPGRSQLDWARDLNPTIVTLTIGANDVGLFDLEQLLLDDAGEDPSRAVDMPVFDERVDQFSTRLREVLEILVTSTDAHIAVTTYYNPTAVDPNGVDGCEGACFTELMDELVFSVNRAILEAIESQPESRLSTVRLDGEHDVWEASNGAGPDFLRDGLGPLQGIVDQFTQGSNATCASTGKPDVELVSTLDCVHPNEAGHRELAKRVAEVLLSI